MSKYVFALMVAVCFSAGLSAYDGGGQVKDGDGRRGSISDAAPGTTNES